MRNRHSQSLGLFCLFVFSNLLLVVSGCGTEIAVTTTQRYETVETEVWVEEGDGALDESEYYRIAIYPLRGNSADTSYFTTAIENALLTMYPGVSVISRQELETVLSEQDLGQSGRLKSHTIAALREIFGVQVIITGEVNTNSWTLQAIDTETARVLWGANDLDTFDSVFPSIVYSIFGGDGHYETITERVLIEDQSGGGTDNSTVLTILGIVAAGLIALMVTQSYL